MSSPRIVIIGSAGRMGHALQSAATELSLNVVASLDQGDDLEAGVAQGDVVVDFSFHTVTA
ncbi:MAG: 4-hydroxy-tetrahydrodipicolinate reductase, partial [Verrucomicrobiia bacterium]